MTGPVDADHTGETKVYEDWTEDETTLYSHDGWNVSLTLDEIYAKAKNEWLQVDEDENWIYFETENDGMISSCGYTPKNCADDCFMGINIVEIKSY
ncbi:MAG: hypothetical protein QM640_16280 [Niabella sp.]